MSKINPEVYFVGGYAPRKDLMGTVAYLEEFEHTDDEHTRFYMYRLSDDIWMHQEIDHEIVSIEYQNIKGKFAWHLLSKRGVVLTLSASGTKKTKILGADTGPGCYGYVRLIRKIDGELYVCGMCRQVYKKTNKKWALISKDILAPEDSVQFNFKGLDGVNRSDIYAVGWEGEIFHYNGSKWTGLDSPTNVALNSIKCFDEKNVYICGKEGVFLYGNKDGWQVVQNEDIKENFLTLEIFQGVPYMASYNGIYKFDGERLALVDTKLKPSPKSGFLHANNKFLWSFGCYDTIYFDGEHWTRVICPDNK